MKEYNKENIENKNMIMKSSKLQLIGFSIDSKDSLEYIEKRR